MRILYCVLVATAEDTESVMEATTDITSVNPGMTVACADGNRLLLRTSTGTEVWAVPCALTPGERSALSGIGYYESRVDLGAEKITPESTSLCWDALVSAALRLPCSVWISADSYPSSAISRVAPVRVVALPHHGQGYVLTADELIRFVEN
jgi:hypothetical protein